MFASSRLIALCTPNCKSLWIKASAKWLNVNRNVKCERKRCTTNRENWRTLWGLSSKMYSRIWVNYTRNGLRLGSRHQEPPHTDVSRNLATVVVRGVLPGLRRRITGLLPSRPKSSFQMRASVVFHLETKVLESGGRVEKLMAQVAWSPVFHCLWWFGVQCHLLVLVHCVFWKPKSMQPFTNKFWSTSCFLLLTSFLKMLTSFSSKIWHLPALPKAPEVKMLKDHGIGVLDWPANADELKATVKETCASIPHQQCHKLMPRRIEAVIKAEGTPTKYWVHLQ